MIIVGLTGGIGSGKTTVAKAFEALGVPTYIADVEAKKLMNKSKIIKRHLIKLFGEESYVNQELNRPFIATAIFNNKNLLKKMNAIVHPKVAKHFKKWVLKQKAPYVLKESAILFEHGGEKDCDFVILVTAPKEVRIQRVIDRDNTTRKKIEAIISNQLSDEEKLKNSNFIITNMTHKETKKQVISIHSQLLKAIKTL